MPNLWKLSCCLVRFFRSNYVQKLAFYHQILQPEYTITWIFLLPSIAIEKRSDRRKIWIFCTFELRPYLSDDACKKITNSFALEVCPQRNLLLCQMSPTRNNSSLANIFNRQNVFSTSLLSMHSSAKILTNFAKWNGVFLWQCLNGIDPDQAQNSARIHAILPSLVEDFLRHIIIGVHFMWHIA